MKTWLTKFNISNALDDADTTHEVASHGNKSEAVSQFEKAAQSLDRRLRAAQPVEQVPTGLHASVMRAVRGASRTREQQSAPAILRWQPATALALLILAGVWWTLSRPEREPQPLVTAAAVLEQGQRLTQQAPAAALGPLTKEMENLNRDFRNAVEVLVASVP